MKRKDWLIKNKVKLERNFIVFLLVLFLKGCFYTFSLSILEKIDGLYITFPNNTTSRGDLTLIFYQELRDIIQKRYPGLVLVSDKENSNYILESNILEFGKGIGEYNSNGDVKNYRIFLRIRFEIKDKNSKEIYKNTFDGEGYFSIEKGETEGTALKESMNQIFSKFFSSLENNW